MKEPVTLEMILAEMQRARMESNARFERLEAKVDAGFASVNARLDHMENFVGGLHIRVADIEKVIEGPQA